MKYQVLFSLKKKEKIFINVVCCSLDWRFNELNTCKPETAGVNGNKQWQHIKH